MAIEAGDYGGDEDEDETTATRAEATTTTTITTTTTKISYGGYRIYYFVDSVVLSGADRGQDGAGIWIVIMCYHAQLQRNSCGRIV